MIIFLPDIVCADERGQSPHVPLEDALVHRVVRGASASVSDDSDRVGAGHKGRGLGGGSHGGIVRRQSRGAGGIAGGRGCLQLQPVVMVTENLMTAFAALAAAAAAARAKPASGEGAAEGSRRFLIPGLQQVPSSLLGLWSLRSERIFSPVIAAARRRAGIPEAHRGRRSWRSGGTRRLERRPGASSAA